MPNDSSGPGPRPSQTQFVILPMWVLTLGQRPAMTYAALASYARDGETYVGLSTVAERLGVTINTVRTGVRELEDAGAVTTTPRYRDDGSQTSNAYHLAIDPPQDPVGHPPQEAVDPTPLSAGGEVTRRKYDLDVPPDGGTRGERPARPEVTELCALLATHVEAVTGARPAVSKTWERDMRLTLERPRAPGAEPWSAEQVEYVIRWLGGSGDRPQFWSVNVRCPSKLRAQMERLVLEIKDERRRGTGPASRAERIRAIDTSKWRDAIPGSPFQSMART